MNKIIPVLGNGLKNQPHTVFHAASSGWEPGMNTVEGFKSLPKRNAFPDQRNQPESGEHLSLIQEFSFQVGLRNTRSDHSVPVDSNGRIGTGRTPPDSPRQSGLKDTDRAKREKPKENAALKKPRMGAGFGSPKGR